ncbi:MAG TPA: potassium-transporting ATPase subunit KdpA, partial [Pedococcus sp.]|nr:potassium-transporting ATPase subunit KdpA [Pedococcus sp.]
MSDTVSGLLTIGLLVLALALVHVPLGDYLASTFTSEKHWRVERFVYRIVGVRPDSEQRWTAYTASVLGISAVSTVG